MQAQAYVALRDGLVGTLAAGRAILIDDTGRTASFKDNLVPTLSRSQVAILRTQLMSGDGGELACKGAGVRPDAHAAHSSSALVFNAFGAWLGHEQQLTVDGVGGFTDPLRVEARQRIFRGGRAPNLDCLLVGPDVVAGVESKLTEPLSRHQSRPWRDAYGRESCRALLDAGWRETLDSALAGGYATAYLDVDQLLKYALGLSKQHPHRARHLIYVYWEPTDADEIEEVRLHRAEVAELLDRVGDASPRLHALTYDELWTEWDGLDGEPWLLGHLAALRKRYVVPLAGKSQLRKRGA
ncbi:hypothetical protein AYO39_01045 [Actinobacteria bacterium SCGC AG-212-D09]|nr:hypothetical protein AYO39_01045 [Actinobacteria bacterium SCGC AG-212-D09]